MNFYFVYAINRESLVMNWLLVCDLRYVECGDFCILTFVQSVFKAKGWDSCLRDLSSVLTEVCTWWCVWKEASVQDEKSHYNTWLFVSPCVGNCTY